MKLRTSLYTLIVLTAFISIVGCRQKADSKGADKAQATASAKVDSEAKQATKATAKSQAPEAKTGIASKKVKKTGTTSPALVPAQPKVEPPTTRRAESTKVQIIHSSNLQGEVEPCG